MKFILWTTNTRSFPVLVQESFRLQAQSNRADFGSLKLKPALEKVFKSLH